MPSTPPLNIPTAVIGAGIAGLACARYLHQASCEVALFEKARGTGGRLSSRHLNEQPFDLGAQIIHAQQPIFLSQLLNWAEAGQLVPWSAQGGWCGTPRMSSLTRHLSEGLTLYTGCRITRLERKAQGWLLEDEQQRIWGPFAQVILALPAPQAAALLDGLEVPTDLIPELNTITMQPCWTGYFSWDFVPDALKTAAPFGQQQVGLRRWLRQAHKPSSNLAADSQLWVVEAEADWTRTHLAFAPEQAAQALFALWQQAQALPDLPPPDHLGAHRWLYALCENRLLRPHWQTQIGLHLCGDYFQPHVALDKDETLFGVETAYLSGRSLAEAILADTLSKEVF